MAADYQQDLSAADTIAQVGGIVRRAARRLTGADGATFALRDGDLFVRSLVMVPIRPAEPIGAIGAYWATTGVERARPVATLERLAGAAADAIQRIGLADAPWAPNFGIPRAAGRRPASHG